MVWRRSLENVLGMIRTERERFVREVQQQQQQQQQQQAAASIEGDKNKATGDRRRNANASVSRQPREVGVGGD